MVVVALGLVVLVLLLWAANAFSRASVTTIKALLAWVAALGGLSLATLLLLTGRGGFALSGLVFAGPAIWRWWQANAAQPKIRARAAPSSFMTRAEALEVLGLHDPVSEVEVRVAWKRLMRRAHPDSGGSDWLASRVNQAKDVLLARK